MFQKLQEIIKQKKWRNLNKMDWISIALAGVLILIIAMPTGESKTSEENVLQETENTNIENVSTYKGQMSNRVNDQNISLEEAEYTAYLEERLTEVLQAMEGVGKVQVMITLSDKGERVVEKDRNWSTNTTTETDSSGGTRVTTNQENAEQTIYMEDGENSYPYIEKEVFPSVEGVFVVAEGGGNSTVVSNISDAVMALFQVDAHKIKVVKMGSKEE